VGSREATELSYVYAVALHSAGRKNEAMETLEAVLAKHPDNRNVLLALMTFSRDAGQLTVALAYQLAKITPNDSSLAAFIQELKQKLDGSGIPRSPMSAVGPGCVKNPVDVMILSVNRRAGAMDVGLRGGD